MTAEEATVTLVLESTNPDSVHPKELREAQQLGIEALTRFIASRNAKILASGLWLPSETPPLDSLE